MVAALCITCELGNSSFDPFIFKRKLIYLIRSYSYPLLIIITSWYLLAIDYHRICGFFLSLTNSSPSVHIDKSVLIFILSAFLFYFLFVIFLVIFLVYHLTIVPALMCPTHSNLFICFYSYYNNTNIVLLHHFRKLF